MAVSCRGEGLRGVTRRRREKVRGSGWTATCTGIIGPNLNFLILHFCPMFLEFSFWPQIKFWNFQISPQIFRIILYHFKFYHLVPNFLNFLDWPKIFWNMNLTPISQSFFAHRSLEFLHFDFNFSKKILVKSLLNLPICPFKIREFHIPHMSYLFSSLFTLRRHN